MRTQLMSPDQVDRTIDRLAHQIIESNQGSENIALFGILPRGAILARRLASHISEVLDGSIACHDLEASNDAPEIDPELLEGKNIILVDDVLYTGQTSRVALDKVTGPAHPASVQLVVLIDRGHRKFPIQPDFAGRQIPTKYKEMVVVEMEEEIRVFLEE